MTKLDKQKLVSTFMELRRPLFVLAVLWGSSIAILLFSQAASAGLRCDCSQVIDTCSATVSLKDMRVNIESNNKACSRVDYLVDGQPFAALVVGGSTDINWPGQPLRDPQIIVENCRVCAEAGAGRATAASDGATAEPAADGAAVSIVKVMPIYPREAWTNRITGDVTVQFNVSANGVVENIKVEKATSTVFVNNTIDAISRFRFTPARKDGTAVAVTGMREQFQFRVLGGTDPVVTSSPL